MEEYVEKYGILPNIPQLAFLNERILLGRREVMNAESIIQNLSYNPCPLYPRFMNFSEISLSGLLEDQRFGLTKRL